MLSISQHSLPLSIEWQKRFLSHPAPPQLDTQAKVKPVISQGQTTLLTGQASNLPSYCVEVQCHASPELRRNSAQVPVPLKTASSLSCDKAGHRCSLQHPNLQLVAKWLHPTHVHHAFLWQLEERAKEFPSHPQLDISRPLGFLPLKPAS